VPLYEYACRSCGHQFEVIQKFSDPAIEQCPRCGAKVEKLLSTPAIQFKGSGWYITDYARKGSGEKTAGEKSAADKTGADKPAADKSSADKAADTSKGSSETKASASGPADKSSAGSSSKQS
jgi:putative FmdB family regulatory protein